MRTNASFLRPIHLAAFAAGMSTALVGSTAAHAQDESSAKPKAPEGGEDAAKKEKPGEGATGVPGSVTGESGGDKYDAREVEGKAYRFIGLRFRDYIVPKFMFNLFADGGPGAVNVFTFGPELTVRKDGLEFELALTPYADYSMNPFLFKGKKDGPQAYELVSSTLKLVTLSLDIMKDVPIDSSGHFSFLIGGGVGLSAVFGNIYRSQVYPGPGNDPNNPNVNDPNAWELCPGDGINNNPAYPAGGAYQGHLYCDGGNNHAGNPRARTGYVEPSWFDGGSKPVVFPYIALPEISFRYKPIKQLQTRVDAGFSITGFYFGANAAFGL